MTTQTRTTKRTKAALWGIGASLLALPFLMPANAQADDLKISLNFGNAPYGYTYAQPVVHKVVYRQPVVKKVVYTPARTKVVYVDKHRGHGKHAKHDRRHGHDRYERRVAYYY